MSNGLTINDLVGTVGIGTAAHGVWTTHEEVGPDGDWNYVVIGAEHSSVAYDCEKGREFVIEGEWLTHRSERIEQKMSPAYEEIRQFVDSLRKRGYEREAELIEYHDGDATLYDELEVWVYTGEYEAIAHYALDDCRFYRKTASVRVPDMKLHIREKTWPWMWFEEDNDTPGSE